MESENTKDIEKLLDSDLRLSDLTREEALLVLSYRLNPEVKEAVEKLLSED